MAGREGTTIRFASHADAATIADIYNHYITHTIVTFETKTLAASEMRLRMETVESASLPWLVAEDSQNVVGYAYASPWHVRDAYRFSVETTVYLRNGCEGRGIGSSLYEHLLDRLTKARVHTAIGGIALPNDASVALHERFGFKKAAHYKEVGFKFDRWIDVGYWQRFV